MTQLDKRRAVYSRNTSVVSVVPSEVSQKRAFARLVCINKDIDVLYPVVNGDRLCDIDAMYRGYVPENAMNKVKAFWRRVPSQVDNSGLTNEQISQQAKFNSLGIERSEKINLMERYGLFDKTEKPLDFIPNDKPSESAPVEGSSE